MNRSPAFKLCGTLSNNSAISVFNNSNIMSAALDAGIELINCMSSAIAWLDECERTRIMQETCNEAKKQTKQLAILEKEKFENLIEKEKIASNSRLSELKLELEKERQKLSNRIEEEMTRNVNDTLYVRKYRETVEKIRKSLKEVIDRAGAFLDEQKQQGIEHNPKIFEVHEQLRLCSERYKKLINSVI